MSAELFSRYDSVILSALLVTMEDVLYCPRPVCQYAVALEPGEKIAICPSCGYASCIYCKVVYHGIEQCRFRSSEGSFHKFMRFIFLCRFILNIPHHFSVQLYIVLPKVLI